MKIKRLSAANYLQNIHSQYLKCFVKIKFFIYANPGFIEIWKKIFSARLDYTILSGLS